MSPCHGKPVVECRSDFLEILLKGKEGRVEEKTQWEDQRWLQSSSLRHLVVGRPWAHNCSNFEAGRGNFRKLSCGFGVLRALGTRHWCVCVCMRA